MAYSVSISVDQHCIDKFGSKVPTQSISKHSKHRKLIVDRWASTLTNLCRYLLIDVVPRNLVAQYQHTPFARHSELEKILRRQESINTASVVSIEGHKHWPFVTSDDFVVRKVRVYMCLCR